MSNLKVNTINDANGGSAAVLYGVASPPNSMGFRNRIINGDMRIDQRNAGASLNLSATGQFPVDRWLAWEDTDGTMTAQQSSVVPTGFTTSLLFTTGTADASLGATQFSALQQRIEGFNTADLGWGTANAQSVTISFWVRSSLTGTFGGNVKNSAGNRSYPFTYTISAANTWELKTITIPGDTSGTWLTNNGIGINVGFGLGVGSTFSGTAGSWQAGDFLSATGAVSVIGTAGATFYITGVQLEAGTVASNFERVDYGRQLIQCQRYYQKTYNIEVGPGSVSNVGALLRYVEGSCNYGTLQWVFNTSMRATPTVTVYNPTTGVTGSIRADASNVTAVASFAGSNGASIHVSNVALTVNVGINAHGTAAIEL